MNAQKIAVAVSLIGMVLVMPLSTQAGSHGKMIGKLEITNVWARATPPNAKNGAGYLTITNHGKADQLIRAEANVSKRTELHTHKMDGSVMRMREIPHVDIPLHGKAEFKPGGLHVMFLGLNQSLNVGGTVEVTLHFAKSGSVTIKMPIMKGGKMKHGHKKKHSH